MNQWAGAIVATAAVYATTLVFGDPVTAETNVQQIMEKGTSSFVLQTNLIIIDVQINGVDAQFILDTGAAGTALTKDFADRLGLEEADRAAGAGAGGTVVMSIVRVESISAAGLTNRGVQCPVIDITAVRAQVGENIDGVLGFDFFGTGSLHIDYRDRRVIFERPKRVESNNGAVIAGETIRLPRFGVEMTMPSSGWAATTDTPLPMIPVIVTGPGDAKITVTEAEIQGLSMAVMKVSLDGSAAVQVEAFERIDSGDMQRAGRPAYRLEYFGTDGGVRRRYISEAIQFDAGFLVLTCEAPVDSFADAAPAMEAALSSIRSAE